MTELDKKVYMLGAMEKLVEENKRLKKEVRRLKKYIRNSKKQKTLMATD